MGINYPEIGICGLSCRLCPHYHMNTESRCPGCKSEDRMKVGCPFITCAIKRKRLEFCWQCSESQTCEKWKNHRQAGRKIDSFKCYQKLENDIAFISIKGVSEFEKDQKIREQLLREMLGYFNEGHSKSYYCIAATVLEIEELELALAEAKQKSVGFDIKHKSRIFHNILNNIARKKNYYLGLRKNSK
ncbi:MAG: DUF3795 domain-containing protein [Atribacterota bacterium]|nr:DUF3795 domain-containing protein [Atribacterota bacterium]